MTLPHQTIDKLNALRLKPMALAFEEQRNNPTVQEYSFDERFGFLVDAESEARKNSKQQRLFRQAKLKANACPEDMNYSAERGLKRDVMNNLFTCDYIFNNLNVIITGSTGTGKTWVSCALGHAAVRKGYTVLSIRLARLFEAFQIAQGDGTLQRYRAKLAKFDLLIIDDWALAPVTVIGRHELLELIDDRMQSGSIIITSQLPIDKWHDYLGEATIADAILDRVVQRAHRIELHGESLRKMDLPLSDSKEVNSL
jgi:DNA replication protein DnaC